MSSPRVCATDGSCNDADVGEVAVPEVSSPAGMSFSHTHDRAALRSSAGDKGNLTQVTLTRDNDHSDGEQAWQRRLGTKRD